ncbi:hypothetical protein ACFWAY_33465 [Rhodococcus sp. NPDC059968]|uniref:hypothetical protein n=1 Tax=Rhodococcus sp. NPDC059968 TaxID=3347017 RepID=UPI0036734572
MGNDVTKLGDDELIVQLDECRARLGESIANDYGCETVRGITSRVGELEAEAERRGLHTPR